jgi:RNA polymerase sigma-70 factor (ECF subfamily)
MVDDAQLVETFQRSGDETAFRQLVERHRGPVFRLVLSILGPGYQGTAEELTQDVFVKVYAKLEQFRGEAKFSSWLYRIAYNIALDHRSGLRFRTPHVGEEALMAVPSESIQDDPHAGALRRRTSKAVKQCLAELPDLYRSVLHSFYWLGMTVPEISSTLSTPEGTIKSYLYRGRTRLAKLLAERGITNV